MNIWVDADACPRAIKEILYRAAERVKSKLTLVANQPMRTPNSEFISTLLVPSGLDVADDKIAELVNAGDLVITADIPLAAIVIEKGAFALNPRGEFYTSDNIRSILSVRDFMDALRGSGVETGGPKAFKNEDKNRFAAELDKFLLKHK